jgi:hypothetical protein
MESAFLCLPGGGVHADRLSVRIYIGFIFLFKIVSKKTQGFGGKSRRKRPLGRPRRRWEDNIKMDLREVGWGDMNWINLS